MSLRANLHTLMQQNELTTTELAERSGVGQAIIQRLFTGEVEDIKLSIAQKIAAVFSLSLSQLIGEVPLP